MSPMEGNPIKADCFCIYRATDEGLYNVSNIRLTHIVWAHRFGARMGRSALLPDASHMPELRDDLAACRVHLFHYGPPTSKCRFAMHHGNIFLSH